MSTYGEPQELEQGDDAPRTPTEILAQISEEMVPQFLELRAWPENVKKEFLDNLYKSMSNLTETANRLEGKTLLFIPKEDVDTPEMAVMDKDLLQRLETCLIHWTRQIKEVVSENRDTSDSLEGPLEEIAFWEARNNDLSGIGDQLQSDLLQQIQIVLRAAKSQYLPAFTDLSQVIHSTLLETKSNLLYLSILKEPCEKLSKATPSEIPSIIPEILPLIVFIWEKSDSYRSRLSILLPKMSNEIIHRCSEAINFDDIFNGKVSSVIVSLIESIKAGMAWQEGIQKMLVHIKHQREKSIYQHLDWTVDDKTMFAHLVAFIQRCKEILDVCSAQVQFGIKLSTRTPLFGGPVGMQLERSFNDIQAKFTRYISNLKGISYSVLDVRETRWHEDYSLLKDNVSDLEALLSSTISSAFQHTQSVESALTLFKTVQRLAVREHVRATSDKYKATVWNLFMTTIRTIQGQFERQKSNPPIPNTWPLFGGAAVWASLLMEKLNREIDVLDKSGIEFVTEEEKEETMKHVEMLNNTITLFIKTNFSRWLAEAIEGKDFEEYKKNCIFVRQTNTHMLKSNFEPALLRLFNEVHFWQKLPTVAQIPSSVVDFVEAEEAELLLAQQTVLLVVRDYNDILLSLPVQFADIFRIHLKHLDVMITKGLKTIKFNAPNVLTFCTKARQMCSDVMKLVTDFKETHKKIVETIIMFLTRIPLIFIDPRHCYRLDEFAQTQGLWRSKMKLKMTSMSHELQDLLRNAFTPFKDDTDPTIKVYWDEYLKLIDSMILEALHLSVKRSLTDLMYALVGDKKAELSPLYVVEAILAGQKTEWNPAIKNLKKMVFDVREEAIMSAQAFPRVFTENKKKIGNLTITTDNDEEDNETKSVESAQNASPDDPEHAGSQQLSFYEQIRNSTEIRDLSRAIQESFKPLVQNLRKFEQEYKAIMVAFQLDKDPQDAFYETYTEFPNLQAFENDINIWKERERQIVAKEPSQNIEFVRVDVVPLKDALIAHCKQRQEMYVNILNKAASGILNGICGDMDSTMVKMSKSPKTLDDLKALDVLLKESKEGLATIEAKFEPLQKQYELLERCSDILPVPDQETMLLLQLPSKFQAYKQFIAQQEVRMVDLKAAKKKELQASLDQLASDITATRKRFLAQAPFQDRIAIDDANGIIGEFRDEVKTHRAEEKRLLVGIELFGLEQRVYGDLTATTKDLDDLSFLWGQKAEWQRLWDQWKTGQFNDLNAKGMDDAARRFTTDLLKRKTDCGHIEVWKALKTQVDSFKQSLPLITYLRNEDMRERHWEKLKEETQPFDQKSAEFTLEKVFEIGLNEHLDLIQSIAGQAAEEAVIEKKIREVEQTWSEMEYIVSPYKQIARIGSTEDIEQQIDDHLMELASMKGSRYVAYFVQDLDKWEKLLTAMQATTEKLMLAQKEWLYLESIFGASEDMRRQMAKEAREFNNINNEWEKIMKAIMADRHVLPTAQIAGIVQRCVDIQKKLENIKNNLNKFLEDKRMLFPRFYFLSDDDLLKILGHARDPQAVRPHLKKCFASLNDLYFASERKATKMFSLEGEEIALVRPLTTSGAVEAWLSELETIMQETVRAEILRCYEDLAVRLKGRKTPEWVLSHKLQMLLAAGQIVWTAQIEHIYNNSKPSQIKKDIKQLRIQQKILLTNLAQMVSQSRMSALDRLKLVSLITIEDHAREVLRNLAHSKVKDVNDFLWKQQLKFYKRSVTVNTGDDNNPKAGGPQQQLNQTVQKEDHVIAEQTNWSFRYGYEYLGCTDRLVVTSLTDRCYITLVTALYLKLGGNPQGPAGTGKTETVKDLSKALGMYCIIFNCSEGLDHTSMGRMFSGLAQTGAWSCFDEFNRMGVEVLSVIAQQLQEILTALEEDVTHFQFEGRTIPIKETCGVFVTMNPGYAGRSELPDNLKALFRPVAMMVPDSAMIAQIRLYAEGFTDPVTLAQKIDTLYTLSMQQLSRQAHYDWGLRAIKSVLVTAGTYHRQAPEQAEDVVLFRACMNMNYPKLLADDLRLFQGLLGDLFPTVQLPSTTSSALIDAIKACLVESPEHLQIHQALINKIVQFSETKDIRHGVMIVGESGSYKSTVWKILAAAKTRLNAAGVPVDANVDPNIIYQKVRTEILNPKAVTNDELFGYYDKTPEWHDGIVSNLVMRAANEESLDEKWIIFDGPVDTLWIESMNSVLDDSKVLTLTNQARITFPQQVSFLFEVQDLQEASPATVSRCGIIFMDTADFGWQPFIRSWVERMEMDEKRHSTAEVLRKIVERHMAKALEVRREQCQELIPSTDLNGIRSFTRLFDSLTTKENGFDPESQDFNIQKATDMIFCFSLVWSIGATLTDATRKNFDEFVHNIDPSIPPHDTVYEYVADISKLQWVKWEDKFPIANWKPAADTPFHRIFVPTVDTVRSEFLLNMFIRDAHNTLLLGSTGTGKTALAQSMMEQLPENKWIALTINFSAQTSSNQVQDTIESRTDKRGKKFSPIGGKRMATFIDDLNLPLPDLFHSQPPLELLRQWMDYSGWYNRRDKETAFTQINGMQLICAMGPPGGGRNNINPRILNMFNILVFLFPSDQQLKTIFGCLLDTKIHELDDEIREIADPLVQGTLNVYKQVVAELRPLPAKSHYLFNLRDISNVIGGLCRANKNQIDKDGMIRLWAHECTRTFSDRLVDDTDKAVFMELVQKEVNISFKVSWNKVCPKETPLIFCNFLHESVLPLYEEVKTTDMLKAVLSEKLSNYNETGSIQMPLVLFEDAMRHVCRISRTISRPLGHTMLVGVGGSGRESLARLGAFVNDYGIFTIEVTRNFHLPQFRDCLKDLYRKTGLEKADTVFILRDNQICEESFLEDINGILTVGEIPNLFPPDELAQIRDSMREEARKRGISETPDLLYNLFIQSVREHLHVVLCLSPMDNSFRTRLRMYPGLVNCMTIDWFSDWPADALLEVGHFSLAGLDLVEIPKGEDDRRGPPPELIEKAQQTKDTICKLFVDCHTSAMAVAKKMMFSLGREVHITPTSFRELCQSYRSVLVEKRDVIQAAAQKLRSGLGVLKSTREDVEHLRVQLDERKQEVMLKTTEVEELMMQLFADRRNAEEQAKKVGEKRARVLEEEQVARQEAAAAQKELDKVMPGLEKAQESLKSLTSKEIAEVKAYTTPPEKVMTVIAAVMILLKHDTSWGEARKKLADPHFIQDLLNFNREALTDKQMRAVEKYVRMPGFNFEAVKQVSAAAAVLCEWVCNMHTFKLVFDQVAPVQAEVKAKLALLEKKQRDLRESEEALKALQDRVDALNNSYLEKSKEMEHLKQVVAELESKLTRANILVSGLAGERERWMAQVQAYEVDLTNLVGDVLLTASFLAYGGPFTLEYRQELIKLWMEKLKKSEIPFTPNFSFEDFLAESTTVRNWIALYGLPNDPFSIQNGLLVTRGRRWPLMIDPQGQANKWVKALYREKDPIILNPSMRDYIKQIEKAVQFGLPILMQDVSDQLDPILQPVIDKAIFKMNGQDYIKIGDNPILFNSNFQFMMTTKLPNPRYSPEISTKTTIVNFAVKEQGLEEQLLGMIVQQENPDLDKQKNDLVVGIAKNKSEMLGLENKILQLLNSLDPSKSLIDDEEMVNVLQTSKATADRVQQATTEMEQTNTKIDKAREAYRPAASRASLLFFVMVDLASVDSMYQYSLDSYLQRFQISLQKLSKEKKASEIADRVALLNSIHLDNIYRYVVRGLFEKHKILFSFQMCIKLLMADKKINIPEYNFFLRGGIVIDKDLQPKNQIEWLQQEPEKWDNITELDKLDNFHGILQSFDTNSREWRRWYRSPEPEQIPLPGEWESKSNDLQRLIIVRCLRPDRVLLAATQFVATKLGAQYTQPPSFNMTDLVDDNPVTSPIVFVLSPGVDPTAQLRDIAQSCGVNAGMPVPGQGKNLIIVALGRGQWEGKAKPAIDEAVKLGNWVFLANCHLDIPHMSDLERMVMEWQEKGNAPHPNFRLWLSSSPHPDFPIALLQTSVKITTEPPRGLKANMLRLYQSKLRDFESKPRSTYHTKYITLVFALSFFHSVLLERRKFQSLGFNIPYDFNDSDWEVSEKLIDRYLEQSPDITPWDAIKYLVAEVNYGGRITDAMDRRLVNVYVAQLFRDEVLVPGQMQLCSLPQYVVPNESTKAGVLTFINGLPDQDKPEVFGQHPNADIASQIENTKDLLNTIISLQPKTTTQAETTAAAAGEGQAAADPSESPLAKLARDLLEKIPDKVGKSVRTDEHTPLGTVLVHETDRYNIILRKVRTSLSDLVKALCGEVVMSGELESISQALDRNSVPAAWQSGYPSLKPLGTWTRDLQARIEQLSKWGESDAMPRVFWLGGLTFPTGFLTAVKQTSLKGLSVNNPGVSIDRVTWEFHVTDIMNEAEIQNVPKDGGIYARGLYLEGAGWDVKNCSLIEPEPMQLTCPMPIIHFKPSVIQDKNKKPTGKQTKEKENAAAKVPQYACPCYYYPLRTGERERPSYMLDVSLNTATTRAEHWIKRGTALLMNLAS